MKKAFSILLCSVVFWTSPVLAQESVKAYDLAAKSYQMQNYAVAEKIWSSLSLDGNANAQYALAIMHLKKEALDSSDKAAFDLLKRASAQQHVVAMFNLGVAYWEGTGTEVNQGKALNWWEIAAQKQDSGAQYNLGLAYYIGAGRDENPDKAYYWVKQAAENGHPQAPALLTSMTAPSEISSAEKVSTAKTSKVVVETSEMVVSAPKKEAKKEVVIEMQVEPSATEAAEESTASNTIATTVSTTATDTETAPISETTPSLPKASSFRTINTITQLHSQADNNSPAVSTLRPGTLIQKIETLGDWTKVQTPKGAVAWVYETFVISGDHGRGRIIGTNVNVRPTPSTNNATSAPISRLYDGDRVQVLLTRSPWVQIRAARPIPAWILTKQIEEYVSVIEERKQAWLKQSK